MDFDLIKIFCVAIAIFFTLAFGLSFCIYEYNINVGGANIIQVVRQQENKAEEILYEGKSAFVSVQTEGMTTTIIIYKQLFPAPAIDKAYSEKNLIIRPVLN